MSPGSKAILQMSNQPFLINILSCLLHTLIPLYRNQSLPSECGIPHNLSLFPLIPPTLLNEDPPLQPEQRPLLDALPPSFLNPLDPLPLGPALARSLNPPDHVLSFECLVDPRGQLAWEEPEPGGVLRVEGQGGETAPRKGPRPEGVMEPVSRVLKAKG